MFLLFLDKHRAVPSGPTSEQTAAHGRVRAQALQLETLDSSLPLPPDNSLTHLVALQRSYLAFMNLTFLICKMGIMRVAILYSGFHIPHNT